ncbi:MAG: ATP-binding cassette domain-containing protein [Deltaproteobacteria bacterium]|nr:MAG: ATP-binding cassette domain-containing protein [Deltaproteobacteria bacterium]
MFSAQLEDRYRALIGVSSEDPRSESVRFAIDFSRILVHILPDEVDAPARHAMLQALKARTDLTEDELDQLLDLVVAPEHRVDVSEDELRAFGARFGRPEEEALRAAVAEEVDLHAFVEHYGEAEALLLLDALFAVCAVDGEIDPGEIHRLQQAARGLGIDPMLIGALFRKHDVRHATGDFTFDLEGQERLDIGRQHGLAVQLPDPQVALRHARLSRIADQWHVLDLGSGRPTLLNGSPISTAPLNPGDDLRVGPYRLSLDNTGRSLTAFGPTSFSSLTVRGLKRTIPKRGEPEDLLLLDEIDFTVFSGEVVALVGPSGAGKTTLISAIAGIAHADAGEVLLDRSNFHALLQSDRSMVGLVPQEDVVHGELTVEESLRYAGKLRFPSDVKRDAIQGEVDRVLDELGIAHIRSSRIGSTLKRGISGGQRKRVNLGQELLTRTTRVLFLDEPTSGLDPQTAQEIVSQVRQLADDGRIVFIVTHDLSPAIMAMIDHLMVLAPGGRLAWFGPPDEACDYFNVRTPDEIFARMLDHTPEEWKRGFRASYAFRKYVKSREHLVGLDGVPQRAKERRRLRQSRWSQYLTLTERYAKVKVRDWTGTGVLLAQAPILGIAMWIVFPKPDIATLFVLVLSALWFGASASVRELIAERSIWRREARVGLRLAPYVASKVSVLGALVTLQCFALTLIVWASLSMGDYGYSLWGLSGVAVSTGLVGMSMGLLVSAIFGSSEAAVGTLPLLLIPQITFGGLIVKVKDMEFVSQIVAYAMITRYSFEMSIKTGEQLSKPSHRGIGESSENIARFLWELGFRTSSSEDMGIPMIWLGAILFAWFAIMLGITTVFIRKSAQGH